MTDAPQNLAQTLSKLRKGGSKIGTLSSFEMVPEGYSIGNLALDSIIGPAGGLPKGRVVELFGPPSSGKTTCALQAAALVQQQGGRVMYLDHERSLDESYVRALGVDPDAVDDNGEPTFLYEQPDSFEAGANAFRPLMQWVNLVITDSVAAMVTEAELNSPTGKVEFAARAKMMHQYMRQVTGPIAKTGTCMVFINQVQDVIDTSPMGQQMKARGITRTTTPGGSALKFYASLRMSFKQIGNVRGTVHDALTNTEVNVPQQTKTQVTVVKNKVGDPFGQAEVRVRFGQGFSQEWSALDVLVQNGRVKKDTGGIYRLTDYAGLIADDLVGGIKNGVPWVKGEDALISIIEATPILRGSMISDAIGIVKQGWKMKASAEEIAELDSEDKAQTVAEAAESGIDPQELDAMFDKNAPVG